MKRNSIKRPKLGEIIVIGGHEDKDGECLILTQLAKRVGRGKLLIATFASDEPKQQWEEYSRVFRRLGVKRIEHLDARTRQEIMDIRHENIFDEATVLFFTGGDQLKITARFGGTPLCQKMHEMYYNKGGTIAGTSSGASVMADSMLISGEGNTTPDIKGSLEMSPGLGFLKDILIDQHFAKRGRIGRLIAAVAQNPRLLGLGLDEDTAAIFNKDGFTVIGSGSVYVLDGQGLWYTNVTEKDRQKVSVYGLQLHLLTQADQFSTEMRIPGNVPKVKIEKAVKDEMPKVALHLMKSEATHIHR